METTANSARWGERLRQPTALLGAVVLGIQAAFLLGLGALVVRAGLEGEWPKPAFLAPFGQLRPSRGGP